jgi:hypothetical protein
MATYNVKISVVELIEADSPQAAIDAFYDRLSAARFEVLEGSGDAFESDDD